MIKLQWQPDLRAETELTRMGIGFEADSIQFSQIDLKESQVNGARIERALLPEVIEDYAAAMENGDIFPRLVVTKIETGYLVLCGNQRCAAVASLIEAGKLPKKTELEVYVTEPLDKLYREVVARSGNVSHGARSSREERLTHALYCIQSLGMNHSEAARAFVLPQATVNQRARADAARRELQKAGVVGVERLSHRECLSLSQIGFDDSSQKRLAQVLTKHEVGREQLESLVKEVKKQSSTPKRLEVLAEFDQELSKLHAVAHVEKNGRHDRALDRPRRRKFIQQMDALVRFLENGNEGESFTNLEQLQFQGDEDTNLVKSLAGKLKYRLRVLSL